MKLFFVIFLAMFLVACMTPPPRDVNNLCTIFKQYPDWYRDSLDVQRRWRVPVTVQMAIMHQESKFTADARPERTKLLWFIPWTRPSTAYGYAQALNSTWALYQRSRGGYVSRRNFADAVDFIGWYANEAQKRAGITRNNTYALYLAYHEGVGGYQRKTYRKKSWLIRVAHKVSAREQIYQAQLAKCDLRAPARFLW